MDAINTAIAHFGSQAALAKALKITQPTVSEWSQGERPVPTLRCVEIERLTCGAIRRWDLRPKDWFRHWPDLIGTAGAPSVQEDAPTDTPAEQGA